MGIPTLISTNPDSSDVASMEFTSGIDGTYDEYMFVMTDLYPHVNVENLRVTFSSNGGTDYNIAKTGGWGRGTVGENGSGGGIAYDTSYDMTQTTIPLNITYSTGADADQSSAGILHLFTPSNTTFIKQFYIRHSNAMASDEVQDIFIGGYINTTSAVNAVKFLYSGGNISGTIQMYGIA